MRILVFSDSHGRSSDMIDVLDRHPETGYVLFLGDGCSEVEMLMQDYPDIQFFMVSGNNDYFSDAPETELVRVGGVLIFMAHGHRHDVYDTDYYLRREAEAVGARIALHGHTHIAKCEYADGIYVMNPGSISRPRFGRKSYGIIDINRGNIFCATSEL